MFLDVETKFQLIIGILQLRNQKQNMPLNKSVVFLIFFL